MEKQRFLKLIHLLNTVWFGLCVGYILILALRQAGVQWWVIFSLSGQSAVLFFLVVSLYLVAIYRSSSRSQIIKLEHPLTSTEYYIVFYYMTPLLGGLAGIAGIIGMNDITQCLLGISYGSIGATFVVWILLDPTLGLIETTLPASRRLRKERLEAARREKEKEQQQKQLLLQQIDLEEKELQSDYQKKLEPLSCKLTELILENGNEVQEREGEVVDIGVQAWQMGGLDCMQQLHKMAREHLRKTCGTEPAIDWISLWWDGIGEWRNQPLREKGRLVGTPKN